VEARLLIYQPPSSSVADGAKLMKNSVVHVSLALAIAYMGWLDQLLN